MTHVTIDNNERRPMATATDAPDMLDDLRVGGANGGEPAATTGQFPCTRCGRRFDTRQGLTMHTTMKHKPKPKRKPVARKPKPDTTPTVAVLDEVKLLRAVAPDGRIPVGELAATNAWLDEARRIHRATTG